MASPASTYSTVTSSSFLRPRLLGTVEASLGRNLAEDNDGSGQSPAFVVARGRTEPVVARPIEVEGGPSARMVDQPDKFAVAIARQERTMRVEVIVDELEVDISPVRHDQNRGIPHQLIRV